MARFRGGRDLSPITAAKELETVRVFLGFCRDRDWVRENVGRRIKMPRNLKPNEVAPYTPPEVAAILEACDNIGKSDYERLRKGIVLMLRYTALRIGDVAMLEKNRISKDGDRRRLWLHTGPTGFFWAQFGHAIQKSAQVIEFSGEILAEEEGFEPPSELPH